MMCLNVGLAAITPPFGTYIFFVSGALRIKASDVAAVLDGVTCTVTREGDEYVIRIDRPRVG